MRSGGRAPPAACPPTSAPRGGGAPAPAPAPRSPRARRGCRGSHTHPAAAAATAAAPALAPPPPARPRVILAPPSLARPPAPHPSAGRAALRSLPRSSATGPGESSAPPYASGALCQSGERREAGHPVPQRGGQRHGAAGGRSRAGDNGDQSILTAGMQRLKKKLGCLSNERPSAKSSF